MYKNNEKESELIKWINQNCDKWEIICGLKEMTKAQYFEIIEELKEKEFYELCAVLSTIFYEKVMKKNNYHSNDS